jgi:hypothetical protein
MHPLTSSRAHELVAASMLKEAVQQLHHRQFLVLHNDRLQRTQTIKAYALTIREVQHLPLYGEVVSFLRSAHDAFSWWTNDLHTQVI